MICRRRESEWSILYAEKKEEKGGGGKGNANNNNNNYYNTKVPWGSTVGFRPVGLRY
jgi:hypothetical protein